VRMPMSGRRLLHQIAFLHRVPLSESYLPRT
jgi:hypothetical protein